VIRGLGPKRLADVPRGLRDFADHLSALAEERGGTG
jgi:hypothetical protein